MEELVSEEVFYRRSLPHQSHESQTTTSFWSSPFLCHTGNRSCWYPQPSSFIGTFEKFLTLLFRLWSPEVYSWFTSQVSARTIPTHVSIASAQWTLEGEVSTALHLLCCRLLWQLRAFSMVSVQQDRRCAAQEPGLCPTRGDTCTAKICSTAVAHGHVLEVAMLWGHWQDAFLAKIAFRNKLIRGAPVRTHSSPAAAREEPRPSLPAQSCSRCSSAWWDKGLHHSSAPCLCYPTIHNMWPLLQQRLLTLVFYIFMRPLVLTLLDDQLDPSITVLSTTEIIHNW